MIRMLGPMSMPNADALAARWRNAGHKAIAVTADAPITPEGVSFNSGLIP